MNKQLLTFMFLGWITWLPATEYDGIFSMGHIRQALERQGLREGFEADELTVFACAGEDLNTHDSFFGERLTVLMTRVEAEARRKLAEQLRSKFSGDVSSCLLDSTSEVERIVASSATILSSSEDVRGYVVSGVAENLSEGRYTVGVALSWSGKLLCQLVDSLSGLRCPAPDWKREFASRWLQRGMVAIPGRLIFVDSSGCCHVVGVGLTSFDTNSLSQDRNVKVATMWAQKNLLLNLRGVGATILSLDDRAERSLSRHIVNQQLLRMTDERDLGCSKRMVDVGCWIVKSEVLDRSFTVCALAWDPELVTPTQSKEMNTNPNAAESNIPVCSGCNGSEPRLIKVFNYSTGKYEEVYK